METKQELEQKKKSYTFKGIEQKPTFSGNVSRALCGILNCKIQEGILSLEHYAHLRSRAESVERSKKQIKIPMRIGKKSSIQVEIISTSDPDLIQLDSSNKESLLIRLSANKIKII